MVCGWRKRTCYRRNMRWYSCW